MSRSVNPTGQWNLYRIDVTNDGSNGTVDHDNPGATAGSTGPCIGDYPHIGLDANGFFITTNEYAFFDPNEQFMGAQLYAMSKEDLAAGAANVPFEMFENLPGAGAQPGRVHAPSGERAGDRLVDIQARHGVLRERDGGDRIRQPLARLRRDHALGSVEHRLARFRPAPSGSGTAW